MVKDIIGIGTITITDLNDATISSNAPTNPEIGSIWIDSRGDKNILKQWNGTKWINASLDVTELDKDLSETISTIEAALGNIGNDGLLSHEDRKILVTELNLIIGETLSSSATLKYHTALPEYGLVDSNASGSFANYRFAAREVGIKKDSSVYRYVQETYTNMIGFLGRQGTPRPWDIRATNKDKSTELKDEGKDKGADVFRAVILEYFLAELALVTATDEAARDIVISDTVSTDSGITPLVVGPTFEKGALQIEIDGKGFKDGFGPGQEPVPDYAGEKRIAVAALAGYVQKSDYKTNLGALNNAISAGTRNINAAKNINAINLALETAKKVIDKIEPDKDEEVVVPPVDTTPKPGPVNEDPPYMFDFSLNRWQDEYICIGFSSGTDRKSVHIPSSVDGIPITEISDSAFRNTNIESLVIPTSIFAINNNAFYGLPLGHVTLKRQSTGYVQYGSEAFHGSTHPNPIVESTNSGASAIAPFIGGYGFETKWRHKQIPNPRMYSTFGMTGPETLGMREGGDKPYFLTIETRGDAIEGTKNLLATEDYLVDSGSVDGFTVTLDNTSSGALNNNFRFRGTMLTPNTNYVISFKTQKQAGVINKMAGHQSGFESYEIYMDGKLQDVTTWSTGVNYPEDTDSHTFEIKLRTADRDISGLLWYIQPNRSAYGEKYKLKITDIKLEEGTKATKWTPAPGDTEEPIAKTEVPLPKRLEENDRLFLDTDGKWKIKTPNGLTLLTKNAQTALNNIPSYKKNTLVSLSDEYNPNIKTTIDVIARSASWHREQIAKGYTDSSTSNSGTALDVPSSGAYEIPKMPVTELSKYTLEALVYWKGEEHSGILGRDKPEFLLEINPPKYEPIRYIRSWSNGNSVDPTNKIVEIKATDVANNNVAQGIKATVTRTEGEEFEGNTGPLTNNNTNGVNSVDLGEGEVRVDIDLGKVYTNIKDIRIWRYYSDSRSFNDTQIEVSVDGESWAIIYTGDPYPETQFGKTFPTTLVSDIGGQVDYIPTTDYKVDAQTNDISKGEGLPTYIDKSKWNRVTVTYDGIETRIYSAGTLTAVKDSGREIDLSNLSMGLGKDGALFDGYISDVRVWNKALTESQVFEYFSKRLTGEESGLILNYRLNGGNLIYDSGPYKNHIETKGNIGWVENSTALKDLQETTNDLIDNKVNEKGEELQTTWTAEMVNYGDSLLGTVTELNSLLDDRIDSVSTAFAELDINGFTIGGNEFGVGGERLEDLLDGIGDKTKDNEKYLNNMRGYFNFQLIDKSQGIDEEVFTIGVPGAGGNQMRLTKNALEFWSGGDEPAATISNEKMKITSGIFVKSLKVGEHIIETVGEGHTVWKWDNRID